MDALPGWLVALPDAETMRGIDRWAIEERGVPSLELMERAGAAVARAVEATAPDGRVAVACGKGNNGGDGLVAARLLRDAARDVTVVCATSPQELAGDARESLRRLPGEPPVSLDGGRWDAGGEERPDEGPEGAGANPLAGAAVLVDGLLGTGFKGEPTGAVARAIDALNDAGAPIVSVDVPSGVDGSSGVVSGTAVRATRTVTFHAAKPGLWIHPGKAFAGEVDTIDIGIPRGAPGQAAVGLITEAVLDLLPRRGASSTKFASGHLVVVGGSRGLTGALRLAAAGSMRAGAGYVTVCSPSSLQGILASGDPPEMLTRGLPDADGALTEDGVAIVLALAERAGAVALGPGLGRADRASLFARTLARDAPVPLLLDADALNAHAGRLGELAARGAPLVLTPHAGELGRLLTLDSSVIDRERLRHVRGAAAEANAVVVLKGDDSMIADPAGRVAVSPGASPALATAGTGDVLTGVIGALLAQGIDAFAAAAAGVWLHAAAGREAARRAGSAEGVVASDVIAALPAVRAPSRGVAQPRGRSVQEVGR